MLSITYFASNLLTLARDRKVKCDEAKPSCLRCIRAGRLCEGYPNRDSPHETKAACSPIQIHLPHELAIRVSSPGSTSDSCRFSKLGCELLRGGSLRGSAKTAPFWNSLLPQLAFSDCGIHNATAALGAAAQLQVQKDDQSAVALLRWYGKAVTQVQKQLTARNIDSNSIPATCLLLAFVDLFAGRELQALAHFQGFVALLLHRSGSCDRAISTSPPTSPPTPNNDETLRFVASDELDYAALVLDINIASYVLSTGPRLPPISTHSNPYSHTTTDPESLALQTLHASYVFASTASHYKYLPSSLRPSSLSSDQSRHIARLRHTIAQTTTLASHSSGRTQTRALVLNTHAKSCQIYLSTLLSPYEKSYDAYTNVFASILADAEAILSQDQQDRPPAQPSLPIPFTPDLGPAQPLFLTALKCRVPSIRQRAIHLLKQTGRDGPFDGPRAAGIAARASEIEASESESQVPEERRLHGCGAEPVAARARVVGVMFSLCEDVEGLVGAGESGGVGEGRWWRIWREEVRFG